jgi:glucose/arabinose dehydrogenase
MRISTHLLGIALALSAFFGLSATSAQDPGSIPRPPAQQNGSEAGSIATDGYAPLPQWLGQTRAPHPAAASSYRVEEFASGLMGGYGFHFLPDRRILVSERGGRLRIVSLDGKVSEPLGGLPKIYSRGPQGLCDVIPDADFSHNRTLYLSYTALPDSADPAKLPRLAGILTIARAQLSQDEHQIEHVTTLLNAEGIGGRMIQARDKTLFITSSIPSGVGIESSDWPQPQQLDSLMGKVLRINPDGSVPPNNPFVGKAGARSQIYAYGLRDDQGVALHPVTGQLWTSEHGPKGGDEINAIQAGKNYGFPVIGYGREYDGKVINGDRTYQEGLEQPVYFWTPDIAPSGISFYSGRLFPDWRGNLFVAALAAKHLVRLVVRDGRVIAEERLLTEMNARIRDVRDGPDGALYVMTDGMNGKILRLIPGK